MRSLKVISIRREPRPPINPWPVVVWCAAMCIWYFLIWAAIGGYKLFHHFIDRILGA